MVIKLSEQAIGEFRRMYETFPDLSPKDNEILESLLWHLANTVNTLTLTMSEGDLVIYEEKRKW